MVKKPRLGKKERAAKRAMFAAARLARKEATPEQKAEEKLQVRAWGKVRSAIQLGYDRPVNRQAAKDLGRPRPKSN